MQARGALAAQPVPDAPRRPAADALADAAHEPGARVFHVKFGYGTVEAVEGDKLKIAFEKAGRKMVVGRFVTAADGAADIPF